MTDYHREWTWRKQGISPEFKVQDYENMVSAQGGVCAACGNPPDVMPLVPDHDENSGLVRALVCIRCNFAMAAFQDSPNRMRCAAAYVCHFAKADPAGRSRYRKHSGGRDYERRYKPLFDEIAARQGNVCAICLAPPSGKRQCAVLHMDHDHATGLVRGLLCHRCNRGVGQAQDDVGRLEKLADYVQGRSKLALAA